MAADFDSPWKEALEKFLRPLMELCFPEIAAHIDWRVAPNFLETELHELLLGAVVGRQHVDKLVEVTLLNGEQRRILLHIEVQHRPEQDFVSRLYSYHRRLEEKGPVVTVAILADTSPHWRAGHYESDLLGCRVRFEFPICKLLDLVAQKGQLETSRNPAAVLVLANWAAQQTAENARERYQWKRRLMRSALEKGLRREDIVELYRLIDWLLELPDSMEKEFRTDLAANEEPLMPYVTSLERLAKEEGRQAGRHEGRQAEARELLRDTLLVRFGELPSDLLTRIDSEQNLANLKSMHRLALTSKDLSQFLRGL